ncbi:hypothetical protein Aduo_003793 [Ancylostoma duodenale]
MMFLPAPEQNHAEEFAAKRLTSPYGLISAMVNGHNGILNLLVIGNAFACNQANLIYTTFASFIREFHVLCLEACVDLPLSEACEDRINYSALLDKLRPDYIFILARSHNPTVVGNILKEDAIFVESLQQLNLFSKRAQKVYVLRPLPPCQLRCASYAMFRTRGDFVAKLGNNFMVYKDFDGRETVDQAIHGCTNCEVVDYLNVFTSAITNFLGFVPSTNRMVLNDENNLNQYGLEVVLPVYERISNDLRRRFEPELNQHQ